MGLGVEEWRGDRARRWVRGKDLERCSSVSQDRDSFRRKKKLKGKISRNEAKSGCGFAVKRKFEVGIEKRGQFLLSQRRATEFQARHERPLVAYNKP